MGRQPSKRDSSERERRRGRLDAEGVEAEGGSKGSGPKGRSFGSTGFLRWIGPEVPKESRRTSEAGGEVQGQTSRGGRLKREGGRERVEEGGWRKGECAGKGRRNLGPATSLGQSLPVVSAPLTDVSTSPPSRGLSRLGFPPWLPFFRRSDGVPTPQDDSTKSIVG